MKKAITTLTLLITIGLVFTACNGVKKEHEAKEEVKVKDSLEASHDHGYEMAMESYQCPMKCEGDKTYHEEGTCPVCKMKLAKIEEASDGTTEKGNSEE